MDLGRIAYRMSLKFKTGFIAALLFVVLGLSLLLSAGRGSQYVSCERDVSRDSAGLRKPAETQSVPSPSTEHLPIPVNPVPVVPAIEVAQPLRRDADFWPQQPHPITLRRHTILPSRELSEAALQDKAAHVWLAQFGGPLDEKDKTVLRKEHRIEALCPSSDMCFYVRAAAADLADAADRVTPALLGWARLEAADKFLDSGFPRDAASAQLRVELHSGGDLLSVSKRVEILGGKVLRKGANWLEAERPSADSLALAIAELDDVYAIEPVRPHYVMHNAEAEADSNATPLFSAPFNLTGAGITVMVRDEGRIFAHPDFGSRLLFGPDVSGQQTVQHATHVAGTIGGDGSSNPPFGARGFAPGCTIVSYDLSGDETAEPLQAFQTFGAVLSNHSYGFVTGWDNSTGIFTDNQATFGLYATFARNWDNLVRTQNLILIKSAGNLRNGSGAGHPHNGSLASDGDYYDTIDESGTSKNVLVVGAASDSAMAGSPSTSTLVLPSSSSGPTSDGRLRPEIVANGDTLLSCDDTAHTGNTYVSLSGTSMAAAATTGTTVLFLQRYKQKFGVSANCAPHYLRAAYAQTATDLGRPGPDYLHGYGMLDASAAVVLLDADAGTGTRILSSTASASTPERFFLLTSDGSGPIKGTLCWSDDPGDALAKNSLVNDLDIRLVKADDQTVSFPYTLNASVPDAAAKPGINTVDTLEQVVLSAPLAGNYLFAVRGTTLISTMPFALASSHALTEVQPPVPSITTSGNTGPPPFQVNFDGSGSRAASGEVIVQYLWSFGDGSSAQGAQVQHIYPAGVFQAVLKVIDNMGASASATVTISVANKPPVAVLSASPPNGGAPLSVLFSAAGSVDPDGTIQSFDLNFGDGTSGSGASVSHTYASPGLYLATLTVTDNGGATASKSTSVYVGEIFPPTTSRFALNFTTTFKDSFSISTSKLAIAPNIDTTGLKGTVVVGQATYNFILDAKGNYRTPGLTIRIVPLSARMTIRIAQTNLAGALSLSGVSNITVKAQKVYIPFAVNLANGNSFGSPGLPFSYTAKQNARGTGVFLKAP